MTSRISQLCVVDALFTNCSYIDIDKSVKMIETTYETFKKYNR